MNYTPGYPQQTREQTEAERVFIEDHPDLINSMFIPTPEQRAKINALPFATYSDLKESNS